jgi:hypothetical protein
MTKHRETFPQVALCKQGTPDLSSQSKVFQISSNLYNLESSMGKDLSNFEMSSSHLYYCPDAKCLVSF